MAEQVIDIRERIEKMRIKFEDDHKSEINDEPNLEKNFSHEEKKEITNLPNEFNNQKKEKIKISLKNYDYKIVDLLKVLGVPKNKKIDSASWILKLSGGVGVEVFWVTKNKNFICGDHSF